MAIKTEIRRYNNSKSIQFCIYYILSLQSNQIVFPQIPAYPLRKVVKVEGKGLMGGY